jgi:peptidase YpeB-like protein
VLGLVALTFAAAQACQKSRVRIPKEQAVATAERHVRFEPRRMQIRLIRQGVRSSPVWAVSLSVPGRSEGAFSHLAVVRVDANTGKVLEVAVEQ